MKDLIIIVGTVVLGCLIFNLMVGNHDSLKAVSQDKVKTIVKSYEDG